MPHGKAGRSKKDPTLVKASKGKRFKIPLHSVTPLQSFRLRGRLKQHEAVFDAKKHRGHLVIYLHKSVKFIDKVKATLQAIVNDTVKFADEYVTQSGPPQIVEIKPTPRRRQPQHQRRHHQH